MLIDDTFKFGINVFKMTAAATDVGKFALESQLVSLGEFTPRYDIHNVYATLNPNLISNPQPGSTGEKRNAEATDKKVDLIAVAEKAPVYPPFTTMWMEHRYSDTQRLGYLMTFSEEFAKWTVTVAFDSNLRHDGVDYLVNAFEILLGDDEMFGGFDFAPMSDAINEEAVKEGAVLVRTALQLLNWEDDDPTSGTQAVTQSPPKKPKVNSGRKPARKKSTPTIIRFEPFLKHLKQAKQSGGSGGTRNEAQHLVRASRPIYTMQKPLGGATDPRTGKKKKLTLGVNYGMLRRKQFMRGNPKFGKKHVEGTIFVGDVRNPNKQQAAQPQESEKTA